MVRLMKNKNICPHKDMCIYVRARVHSHSIVSDSLRLHGLQPTSPGNIPGKNTGVGCHFLLQIIPTQELNPCLLHLLHWQAHSSPLCHLRSPHNMFMAVLFIIGKNSKQPISLPDSECISKLWNTCTTGYFTAIMRINH